MTHSIMTIGQLASDLLARLPAITGEEQRLGVEIYRQLAEGRPVAPSRLAQALHMTTGDVAELLKSPNLQPLTYADAEGRVIGFGGLALEGMPHRFIVDGRTLYTWCAWDSLFIPGILGRAADVSSPVPQSGARIRLTVTPNGVQNVEPQTAVMSFLLPSAETFQADALKAIASFCHFIFFFPTAEAAAAWTASRPDTSVMSLADAFELGRRMIAARYGSALESR
ncbi:MAG TPA: organomercurial lyase [Gemmatimonadales bacterium]|nr:organomercurial lyase [Gemmatimonadales bacterium]